MPPQLPPGFVLDTPDAPPARSIPGVGPKAPAPPSGYRETAGGLEAIPGGPADPSRTPATPPSGYRFRADGGLEAIPGGPADKAEESTVDQKDAQRLANLEALTGQINRVQELYNKNLRDEALGVLSSMTEYLPTPTNRQFDSASAGLAEQGLAAFRVPGVGAQSDTELRQFVEANRPSASDFDSQIEEKLRQLRNRVQATRAGLGLPPAEWTGLGGTPADQQQQDRQPPAIGGIAAPPPPPPPQDGGGTPPRTLSPAPTSYAADPNMRTVANPGMAGLADEYRQRLASGQSAAEILPWLRDSGVGADTLTQAIEQIRYRDQNPNVPIDRYQIDFSQQVPTSAYERAITTIGDSAPGAYALGAGQFLSGNTLDNLAPDPERARLAADVVAAGNPTATTVGELSGGVLAALGGEAALARAGIGSGLARSVMADAAMGGANGAGAADNGDRLAGAMRGAGTAAVGSAAGTGVTRLAGRALSPTGGAVDQLYEAGVRPTPGQRFADSGMVGRAVNAGEEALQSVPVVGSAIRGARQEARDQFQTGAFNQALAEIGLELPANARLGTAAHQYAQRAFNEAYDRARSGMRMVADEELANDLDGLAPDIATLSEAGANRARSIIAQAVRRHITDNELTGNAYKDAVSDLGKQIGRFRKGANSEDQQIADILEGVRNAMDSAARRHSDPDAVALMDAADAGYAKLVRIEDAAARRGGDAGEFSPTQLDAAVQRQTGGVRSRAYLRGEGQMQEYAQQGRNLNDRLGNSGTTDRALAATAATGGAAYLEPSTLALLSAIGLAYAPGVRRATTAVFAPPGPVRKAIAQQLKDRARLAGRATAAGAVVASQGTAGGQ